MQKTEVPMDIATLEKVKVEGEGKVDSAAKMPARKRKGAQKAPIYREPPRGQMKGPIVAGPTDWIVCVTCSRLFSTPEKPVRYGIRKRHAKKHLADHRLGRIRRPVEPEAKKAKKSRARKDDGVAKAAK